MDAARRRFLVVGHTQTTDPGFSLNDLAGGAGRIDVLARAVTSALCLSHGLRADTEIWTVIAHPGVHQGPRTLVWRGDRLVHLNPDERSTAALFKKAFAHDAIDQREEVHPGLEVAEWDLTVALERFVAAGPAFLLDRAGTDLRGSPEETFFPAIGASGFVLSDHRPFAPEEAALFAARALPAVSVGPEWLHGHHAIALVHDEWDRRLARR